ncbi:hypothetical protein SAMN05421736_105241 [Evansella caseinilytica]|uniref:Antigen I/II N-terminal domain-containing protein n=1 Tax=Evansella caseinilytica TaxID=1503961 RepID=A0A1H3PVM8_9BACI|nr:hypothetical protein [Evansella caseinilytica]SDZ05344.1 hypothetical protein SAMN05421736_105241 [Evansella caseinilytica]
MKKLLTLLMVGLLVSFLAACGDKADDEQPEEKPDEGETAGDDESADDEQSEEAGDESISVDKGQETVEITLPASLVEGQDIDETIADAKESGVEDVIQNEDGSLTYKMSSATYQEMLDELVDSMNEAIEEIKNSEDFVSIKDVTANSSFSEFTMVVDQEAFENSFDAFAALGLGITGMYYQVFEGVAQDDIKVTINLENEETGDIFDTVVYPDDLE